MELDKAINMSLADAAGGVHSSIHEHLTSGMQSAALHEAAVANGVGRIVFCILLAATLTFGHRIGRASKGLPFLAEREEEVGLSSLWNGTLIRFKFVDEVVTGILAYSSEAAIAILMGLGAGALLYQWGSVTGSPQVFHLSAFPEDVFFFYLLPPIILNAGFQLHPARFMKYIAPILILGLAGTLLSSVFIAFGGKVLVVAHFKLCLVFFDSHRRA